MSVKKAVKLTVVTDFVRCLFFRLRPAIHSLVDLGLCQLLYHPTRATGCYQVLQRDPRPPTRLPTRVYPFPAHQSLRPPRESVRAYRSRRVPRQASREGEVRCDRKECLSVGPAEKPTHVRPPLPLHTLPHCTFVTIASSIPPDFAIPPHPCTRHQRI